MFLELLKTPSQAYFKKAAFPQYRNQTKDFVVRKSLNGTWYVDLIDSFLTEQSLIYTKKFKTRKQAVDAACQEVIKLMQDNIYAIPISDKLIIEREYMLSLDGGKSFVANIFGNSNSWSIHQYNYDIGTAAFFNQLFKKYGYINDNQTVAAQTEFKTRQDIVIMFLTILDQELGNLYDQEIYLNYLNQDKDIPIEAWWCSFVSEDIDLTDVFT